MNSLVLLLVCIAILMVIFSTADGFVNSGV